MNVDRHTVICCLEHEHNCMELAAGYFTKPTHFGEVVEITSTKFLFLKLDKV